MYKVGTLESAYILHTRSYQNSSVILDLLTQDAGRYSVVTKGARSQKSKIGNRLQPFTPLLVASVGRGEMKTSTTIDFPRKPYRLTGQSLMLGLYVNELLYRLLDRYDPVPGLYIGYEELLLALQLPGEDVVAVRRFELRLLQELGYGINFEYDARDGQPVSADRRYSFTVHEGFHATTASDDAVFPGSEVLQIAEGALTTVSSQRLLKLTRSSLAELLQGKPLKSRALFGHSSFSQSMPRGAVVVGAPVKRPRS